MFEALGAWSAASFVPHGYCISWSPLLLWTLVGSDSLIAASYYSIPAALIYFVRKRPDVRLNWVLLLFSAFILFCGTTHLLDVWVIWTPDYQLLALAKVATALASVTTAVALWPLIPKALKIPSVEQLQQTVDRLQVEVRERQAAEAALAQLNATLEQRVRERTEQLQSEVAEVERLRGIEREREAAEAASRAKSEFLSRMSHELRTPMNAILGFTQLLLMDQREPMTPTQAQRLQYVHAASTHLLQMIDDVLDISRIETGTMTLRLGPVDLAASIDESVQLLSAEAGSKAVVVTTAIAPGLLPVRADALRLRQALTNILSNAIKYNVQGGRVQVSAQREDGRVVLQVRDTGVGMSEEQQRGLFQPFNRLGREAGSVPGTGIGLVIVRNLVTMMGGSIALHSEPGVGTVVTVTLTVEDAGAAL